MRFFPRIGAIIPLIVLAMLSPGRRAGAGEHGGPDWWAWQPVGATTAPAVRQSAWCRNELDRHVLRALEDQGLAPSPPAEARVLIRRLTFDLTGLPPSPEEVGAFVKAAARDRQAAIEELADRLLASPAYGEKWGRHWLDVARFGESDGFEFDKPRPEAWRYRDWVIQALNADVPYDRFVQWQIAGDVLEPNDPEAIIATGFLVGGPYDDTNKVTASENLRRTMRQDELEDIVGTVGQTLLGVTIHCARCHDHKFDPVAQRDYYALASCFAGLQRGNRNLPAAAPAAAAPAVLAATDPAPKPLAEWNFDTADGIELVGGARIADGALVLNGVDAFARTPPLAFDLREKTLSVWVRVDPLSQQGGAAMSVQSLDGTVFDAVVIGERDAGQWMAGSDFYRRWKSFNGPAESSPGFVRIDIVYHARGTIAAFRDGQPYGAPYRSSGLQPFKAGESRIVFGLRHGTAATPGRMLAGAIKRARLYDRAISPEPAATDVRPQAFAVVSGAAPVVHRLDRGSIFKPQEEIAPGGLECLRSLNRNFGLPADAPEGDRRRALAAWITSRDNPLFARAIVNRVWHWRFGRGLVPTPNDLGYNGGQPSHPALLDWLAGQLRDGAWSLKRLHRLIVTSATFQQASRSPDFERAMSVDAGDRLLWRFPPRRLEAEEIRDAILAVAGVLDPRRGGPGFQDFRMENTANTMHYHPDERDQPEFHRRSIYRMAARGGANPLLNAFDCPDCSANTPVRTVTTTPLGALSLLNGRFTLTMSQKCAARLEREAGADPDRQIVRLHELACGRPPSASELALCREFATRNGLPALCRVIFNASPFVYVE